MLQKFRLFTHCCTHENGPLSMSVCQQADRHEKLTGKSVLLAVLGDTLPPLWETQLIFFQI